MGSKKTSSEGSASELRLMNDLHWKLHGGSIEVNGSQGTTKCSQVLRWE